ncbi:MAG: hypothetical protein WC383_11775 [Gammaproteobacteria bacterium]
MRRRDDMVPVCYGADRASRGHRGRLGAVEELLSASGFVVRRYLGRRHALSLRECLAAEQAVMAVEPEK